MPWTGKKRYTHAHEAANVRSAGLVCEIIHTIWIVSIKVGSMQLNLKEKSVIVTGAASNIGRGIALAFAEEGAAVAIADIDEARAQVVADEALARGASKAMAVKADVSNWTEVQAMVATVEQSFGSVDILVNNAGWVVDRLFVEKPRAEWEKEIQLNLWGMINCTRAVLDGMIARKGGAMVSIGSDAGRIGEFREGVYGACKAGVIALSQEPRPRGSAVTASGFNVVCPGMTMPATEEDIGGPACGPPKQ